ncbi:MAG: DNA photolyase [Deltaproteobacteria bacterium]|nr:DNA photolyase [Deltaproteobacteria bacterium]
MSIQKLYIDRQIAESSQVGLISERLKLTGEIVPDAQTVYDAVSAAADPIGRGKKILFLTRNKGAFIKECPGTRAYTCCGYKILHIGSFCQMDCAYCILQAYFHPPVLSYFVNHHDLYRELAGIFAEKKTHRIGTGEFTDSLIWELWTDLSTRLIPAFADQDHAILELKSKTTAVENLARLDHNRKTITSWSVNTPTVIAREERGTASLTARLRAAARCESWGYPLAFHFDPIVIYEGCEKDYRRVIKKIFSAVSPKNIAWISLGSFRFMPALKPLVERRFPKSKIIYGEFITGLDGKMRYFKPMRIKVYHEIITSIRKYAPGVFVYFCMEDEDVWRQCLGYTAAERGGLEHMLDEQAVKHCGLINV